MESTAHSIAHLFDQLGLPSEAEAIATFIAAHAPLASEVALSDAPFWNAAQADFLRTQLAADADWSELIDALDVQLRA